ncbi:hypothetical protein T265_12131 [Opisthorchis viverrini]|uniref:Uncharacterized protein n=1 Tax=Opisthorchis viverrini TaxID=6198 RepID=A0A074YVQ0_OPIVI|nr:hypothetical protein T265_12131 [Opisthorchis viverrini]KER18846.1 hypothetical protein T265_12131 [Opisthorchis viverrini]
MPRNLLDRGVGQDGLALQMVSGATFGRFPPSKMWSNGRATQYSRVMINLYAEHLAGGFLGLQVNMCGPDKMHQGSAVPVWSDPAIEAHKGYFPGS